MTDSASRRRRVAARARLPLRARAAHGDLVALAAAQRVAAVRLANRSSPRPAGLRPAPAARPNRLAAAPVSSSISISAIALRLACGRRASRGSRRDRRRAARGCRPENRSGTVRRSKSVVKRAHEPAMLRRACDQLAPRRRGQDARGRGRAAQPATRARRARAGRLPALRAGGPLIVWTQRGRCAARAGRRPRAASTQVGRVVIDAGQARRARPAAPDRAARPGAAAARHRAGVEGELELDFRRHGLAGCGAAAAAGPRDALPLRVVGALQPARAHRLGERLQHLDGRRPSRCRRR